MSYVLADECSQHIVAEQHSVSRFGTSSLLRVHMQVCDCDCLPVRPLEGDLPAFSAAIFRRDDVHKALVQQQSRKLEQVAAVLQRADSPTSPLPADFPGKLNREVAVQHLMRFICACCQAVYARVLTGSAF